ncbi:MAG: hypothetical protein K6T75_02310 [Acetobacteraceae bacterium]|nr:hypothetical protein [Acetobacteraceae bacterium]
MPETGPVPGGGGGPGGGSAAGSGDTLGGGSAAGPEGIQPERSLPSGPIPPMEPCPWPEPFDSPRHLFQVKWDGVRILAFVDGRGGLTLQNRRLHDRTRQYPELGELGTVPGLRGAVLDGEVVVTADGRPSFPRVLQRDRAWRPEQVRRLARRLPAVYMAFDLLWLGGRDIRRLPLERRLGLMGEALQPPRPGSLPHVVVVESFDHGTSLFQEVKARGLEGVVAKERDSPYLAGKKSPRWLKIKCRRRRLCAVGGFTHRGGRLTSLLLGAFEGQRFLYVGRVSSGLSERERTALQGFLGTKVRGAPAFEVAPLTGEPTRWTEPSLAVVVGFSEWTEGLKLRAPAFEGLASGGPEQCQL